NIPCLRIQRRRSRATSARFCSAAYKVFFEADVASIEEPPNRTTAARHSPLPHRRNHLVQRQIRLPGNQTQQKPHMFLQRRCAAATRLCRNASGLLKALGPKHHHTGADPIAFGRLPPRRACRDVSDHADTQVHGIRPRHRLPPSPNQGGQTRSLTSAWESLRFIPSEICSKFQEAVVAFREALKERTRERVPLDWAATQNNLANSLTQLGQRENRKLEEAIVAYREALKELTRERGPLQWATIQNNMGVVLFTLGERDRGMANLEEAVVAFGEALKERTRERVPLDWAASLGGQGVALTVIAERRRDASMAESALGQINTAFAAMRDGGNASGAAIFEQQLPRARAIVARLRGRWSALP